MTINQPEATDAVVSQPKKPVYKKKRFMIPAAVLVFGIALSSCGGETPANDAAVPAESSSSAGVAAAESAAPAAEVPAPEAPAPEPEAAGPTVGVPFTADMGGGNTARITIVSAEFTDSVSAASFAPAAQNGGFLLLDVLWETEEGVTSANPLYFDVKDADGRNGEMYLFADGQLGSGEVAKGDKSRGFVAFDVAPGAVTVKVSNPLLQEAARLQIGG